MRASLEIAEHDGDAVPVRQAVDLPVNDVGQVVRHAMVGPSRVELGRTALGLLATRLLALGLDGGPKGDAMQPGTERIAHPKRSGLAHQHEEGRLKSIAGCVIVVQDGPAGRPDHRPMSRHQRGERRFRLLAILKRIALKQLSIGKHCERAGLQDSSQAGWYHSNSVRLHGRRSPRGVLLLIIREPRGPKVPFFSVSARRHACHVRGTESKPMIRTYSGASNRDRQGHSDPVNPARGSPWNFDP
jgi:hypothetical protein